MSIYLSRPHLSISVISRLLLSLVVFVLHYAPQASTTLISEASTNTPIAVLPDEYIGVWRGSAVQVNPNSQWTISLALNAGGISTIVGTAGFPSVGCGAELTLLNVQSDSVELLEDVVYGNCVDLGTITLRPMPDGSLEYRWRSSDSVSSAIGRVTRVSNGQTHLPDRYVGVWKGSAVQVNPNVQWPILMTLTKGDIGTIVGIAGFAPYRCGAELTLLTVNAGFSELLEDVTYGPCWDLGTITLTPQLDGTLEYRWRSPDNSSSAIGSVTRVSSATAFLPNLDGYQFNNQSRPLPSWNTFKQTFSNSSLENLYGVPYPLALAFYALSYSRIFVGMCDGMSSSALAYYRNVETRPGGTSETYGLSPDAAWPLIELYHGRQLSKGLQNYRNNLWTNYPGVDSIYNQIKSQLPNHVNDPILMTIVPGPNNSIPEDQGFGHAVVPYRIEEQAGTWGKVFVYDPNSRGDTNRYFYFDFSTSPHTFDYDMVAPLPNGGGNTHVNSSVGWIIELVPLSQFGTADAKVLHNGFLVWLIGNGEVIHTNSMGERIGYQQGIFTSTIPNAAPIYDWFPLPYNGGSFGVSMPVGTYQASINSSGSYEYSASSLTNAIDIKIQSNNSTPNVADMAEPDHVQIGALGSATYTSTATLSRSLSLQLTGNDSVTERQYDIINTTTSGPTMLRAQIVSNGLSVQTSGITSTFDLGIRGPEGFMLGWFVHDGISITSGAAITIEAPRIRSSSVVTVTTSLGELWVLENQVKQVFLPIVTR